MQCWLWQRRLQDSRGKLFLATSSTALGKALQVCQACLLCRSLPPTWKYVPKIEPNGCSKMIESKYLHWAVQFTLSRQLLRYYSTTQLGENFFDVRRVRADLNWQWRIVAVNVENSSVRADYRLKNCHSVHSVRTRVSLCRFFFFCFFYWHRTFSRSDRVSFKAVSKTKLHTPRRVIQKVSRKKSVGFHAALTARHSLHTRTTVAHGIDWKLRWSDHDQIIVTSVFLPSMYKKLAGRAQNFEFQLALLLCACRWQR